MLANFQKLDLVHDRNVRWKFFAILKALGVSPVRQKGWELNSAFVLA